MICIFSAYLLAYSCMFYALRIFSAYLACSILCNGIFCIFKYFCTFDAHLCIWCAYFFAFVCIFCAHILHILHVEVYVMAYFQVLHILAYNCISKAFFTYFLLFLHISCIFLHICCINMHLDAVFWLILCISMHIYCIFDQTIACICIFQLCQSSALASSEPFLFHFCSTPQQQLHITVYCLQTNLTVHVRWT